MKCRSVGFFFFLIEDLLVFFFLVNYLSMRQKANENKRTGILRNIL